MSKHTQIVVAAALAILAFAAPALASSKAPLITVETQDLPGGHMALKSSHQTVAAGQVTFQATNISDQGRDHEVLMIKTDLEPKDLPKAADGKSIDEKKLDGVIELGDLGAGAGKETKIVLEPGNYLMFCNLPGHTGNGMWSRLTVTEKSASLSGSSMSAKRSIASKRHDSDHDGDTDGPGKAVD